MITKYTKNMVQNYGYVKVKRYNENNFKIIQFKHPVRKSGFEEDKKDKKSLIAPCDYENEEESLRVSLSRTKKTIFEYALCNEFDYFVTLTFDRNKYDSTDIVELKRIVGQWLNNYKKRKNPNLKYLLIPELHKDKEHFHFHGLISGIEDVTEFKESYKGVMRYNWTSWHKKFGFTSLERVKSQERVSRYITKYITKDLLVAFGKQRYLVSKGLKKPETYFELTNYTEDLFLFDYENDFVRIKNVDTLDEAMTYIAYMVHKGSENNDVIERSY